MARQIQGSPIVLCFNRWRWDGDRGQVKRDPTLSSILSTNLMRALLCQCTKRGKRLNHFCPDACTASFAKVNFGGIIKHHHLSGGETGEEALLRLLLPPWLVRSSFSTNNFNNNVFSSITLMISPCSLRPKVYMYIFANRCLTTAQIRAFSKPTMTMLCFFSITSLESPCLLRPKSLINITTTWSCTSLRPGVWQQHRHVHNQLLHIRPTGALFWGLCFVTWSPPLCLSTGWERKMIVMVWPFCRGWTSRILSVSISAWVLIRKTRFSIWK